MGQAILGGIYFEDDYKILSHGFPFSATGRGNN